MLAVCRCHPTPSLRGLCQRSNTIPGWIQYLDRCAVSLTGISGRTVSVLHPDTETRQAAGDGALATACATHSSLHVRPAESFAPPPPVIRAAASPRTKLHVPPLHRRTAIQVALRGRERPNVVRFIIPANIDLECLNAPRSYDIAHGVGALRAESSVDRGNRTAKSSTIRASRAGYLRFSVNCMLWT